MCRLPRGRCGWLGRAIEVRTAWSPCVRDGRERRGAGRMAGRGEMTASGHRSPYLLARRHPSVLALRTYTVLRPLSRPASIN